MPHQGQTDYLIAKIEEIEGGENLKKLDGQSLTLLARNVRRLSREKIQSGSKDLPLVIVAVANEVNVKAGSLVEVIGVNCLTALIKHIARQELDKSDIAAVE